MWCNQKLSMQDMKSRVCGTSTWLRAQPTDRRLLHVCMATGRADIWSTGWTAGTWKITRKEGKHFHASIHTRWWYQLPRIKASAYIKAWFAQSFTVEEHVSYLTVLERRAGSTLSSWRLTGNRDVTSELWLSLCLVKCGSAKVEFLIAWHILSCNVHQKHKHMPDCNVRDTKWHSVLILGIEIISNAS